MNLVDVVNSGLDDLHQAVKSGIEAEQSFLKKRMPADFDFEIGEKVFTREFNGESISVKVNRAGRSYHYYDDSDDDDDSSRGGARPSCNLVVNITKENGKTVTFNASVGDDEITVTSMSIKLPTGDGWMSSYDKEEYNVAKEGNLQSAMREYLKSRGIKKSNTDFMCDYSGRISKKLPEDADMLKNLQNFIKD